MSGNPITDPWSSGSYGTTGTFMGEIVSINDPLRRNRVQVRIHGYQNDKGNIPDDKLSWYGVMGKDSQMAGSTSTHMYYPGAKVVLTMVGTEMLVMGATAGFDSDKRRKSKTTADGSSEQPDVPRAAQGEGKQQANAKDGEGKDTVSRASRDPKADKPYQEPKEEDAYKHSIGKAPFNKGEDAKKALEKSIGILKNIQGSDILEMIKGMDSNVSGAVKEGVELIKKLRQSGFGTSLEMIGAGSMQSAAFQFPEEFGAPNLINLVPIVIELLACYKIIRDSNGKLIKGQVLDYTMERVISSLRPMVLDVDLAVIENMEIVCDTLFLSNLVDNSTLLTILRQEYYSGLNQAVAGILSELNQMETIAGSAGGLIALFKDPKNFCDLCDALVSITGGIGTAWTHLTSSGISALALYLQGGIESASKASQQAQSAPGGSGGGKDLQKVMGALNMFMSNPIAKKEMAGGGINPESLLKIPLKYAKKAINDPQKMFNSLMGK